MNVAGLLAVGGGAAVLLWPAAFNGYPILFSDTGGLLEMGLLPSPGWDKPFVYGPLLALLSFHGTLGLPLLAQAGAVSAAIWSAAGTVARPAPLRHVLLCCVLAVATPASWITSTLMPDALTPVVALTLYALSRRRRSVALLALAVVAIASHLSHLVLAAALVAAISLLDRRVAWRPALALALAVAFLLGSNLVAFRRFAVSPYGSVFALARLVADGPARAYLDRVCPQSGLILCPWRSRLTDDSDQFLWDPAGPFWADPAPLPLFAAQAGRIVFGTILAEPGPVARAAYRNAARQLVRVDVGDTLGPDFLDEAVRPRIARWFPAAELGRYDRSRQRDGGLADLARRFVPLHRAALAAALLGCAVILLAGLRRPGPRADFAALVLVALAANAVSTGALSAVHDRYQARIAWLLLLPPLVATSSAAVTATRSSSTCRLR